MCNGKIIQDGRAFRRCRGAVPISWNGAPQPDARPPGHFVWRDDHDVPVFVTPLLVHVFKVTIRDVDVLVIKHLTCSVRIAPGEAEINAYLGILAMQRINAGMGWVVPDHAGLVHEIDSCNHGGRAFTIGSQPYRKLGSPLPPQLQLGIGPGVTPSQIHSFSGHEVPREQICKTGPRIAGTQPGIRIISGTGADIVSGAIQTEGDKKKYRQVSHND